MKYKPYSLTSDGWQLFEGAQLNTAGTNKVKVYLSDWLSSATCAIQKAFQAPQINAQFDTGDLLYTLYWRRSDSILQDTSTISSLPIYRRILSPVGGSPRLVYGAVRINYDSCPRPAVAATQATLNSTFEGQLRKNMVEAEIKGFLPAVKLNTISHSGLINLNTITPWYLDNFGCLHLWLVFAILVDKGDLV